MGYKYHVIFCQKRIV
jgi:hypothetical protein